MLAEMDAHDVDALAYPSIRRIAAPVGEGQPGSACQLSAQTGMPALALPAGWSAGLPVGMELLGRTFDDARLVGFGYAYERENDLRRTPDLTPPTETPRSIRATQVLLMGRTIRVATRFAYVVDGNSLAYQIALAPAGDGGLEDLQAVVLTHADGNGRWSVAANLSGPDALATTGELELTDRLRQELEDGSVFVELITRGSPVGRMREPVDGWTTQQANE
jgi:hypothetical protein